MPKPGIHVDFNSSGKDGGKYFACLAGIATFRDLEKLGLELEEEKGHRGDSGLS